MSDMRARLVRACVCATLANAAVGVGHAWAQTEEKGTLEEVTVTAQKREQALQDVGISVAAFSGEQLQRLGLNNTTAIAQQVPALRLQSFSPALTIFSLRGVSQNNFQDNLEAPVAVYMDGAYVATMNAINAQMFDMERVEVLRGPQGTLFGRNATGGLIHFISRRADEDAFNGYAEVSASEFGTHSAEAAIGGGLADNLRARLAARYEESDGYIRPGTAFGVPASGGRAGGAHGYAVRGSIQADLSERVLLDVTAAYSRDDDVPTGQYVFTLAGFDPNTGLGAFTNAVDPADPEGPLVNFERRPITGNVWRHWSNEFPSFNRDVKSLTAQITADLSDDIELVSISNGMQMDKAYVEDSGQGFGHFPYFTNNDYDQWSQELRLSGGQGDLRWQTGAYYLDMTADTSQVVEGPLALGGTSDTQRMSTYGTVRSKNWSVFGQVEYDIAPQWTLIGGARWSQDDKHLDMTRFYQDVPNGIPSTKLFDIRDTGVPGVDDIDYSDYAARAQLNWKAQEDVLVFLAFNRGIKGGNWSLDPLGSVGIANIKHKPEKLNSYELGTKADLLDNRLRVNVTAFHYDYKDYQAFSLLGITPQVSNSDAKATGGELEISVAPFGGLTLSAGAAFIDSKVDAVPDVFGGTVRAELPMAPAASVNLLAQYEWPLLAGTMAVQLDGRWNDDQFLEGTNSEVSAEPAYSVWNGSLQYRTADESFRASLWVKNFTNEEYRVYNLDLGLLGFIQQVYGPPRQVGVTVSYHWH
ncbi:TonB-dependent receptor [Steroidobacter sp.]|uniref:TonB-dependent receptor n=1 Tax=Steroidobacter sp. TaxID=1978227 RepID=UPI001A3DC5DF|nr:TonB-dependent receptor [Steroidobacter sp.]MBL8268445.1 TonB-dependent receptor [Steroidobacter sp.]